jgi:predicted GIY-YIG superfamily endonuclease
MSRRFKAVVAKMDRLRELLMLQKPTVLGETSKFPEKPGVYLITDKQGHLYTGRAKNIRRRMSNHGGTQPQSSTFAFRLACHDLGWKTQYQKGKGRTSLMQRTRFKSRFKKNVKSIREMQVRYVIIKDDITQHMFEVYVHLFCKTPHNSFATH